MIASALRRVQCEVAHRHSEPEVSDPGREAPQSHSITIRGRRTNRGSARLSGPLDRYSAGRRRWSGHCVARALLSRQRGRLQRLLQVGDQVGRGLEAAGQAHEAVGDAGPARRLLRADVEHEQAARNFGKRPRFLGANLTMAQRVRRPDAVDRLPGRRSELERHGGPPVEADPVQ